MCIRDSVNLIDSKVKVGFRRGRFGQTLSLIHIYAGLQIAGFVGLFAAPVLVLFARYLYENGTEEAL